jgi:hypothetical protein
MMLSELQDLLDIYGADPTAWPPQLRGAAERLIVAEPLAREALEKATRLDLLLSRALRADLAAASVPESEAATGAINALAAFTLPRQGRRALAQVRPRPLFDLNLAPVWPRVAVLASVAALGFGIGLFGLDMNTLENLRGAAASTAVTDTDLSVVAFDPEPLTGVRP